QAGLRAEQRDTARQRTRERTRAERVPTERPVSEPRQQPEAPTPVLQARIPSGTLSGTLPWLRTHGRAMVTLEGAGVVLRGISLRGLHTAARGGGFAGAAALDETLAWGPTVLRVAINRSRVLGSSGQLRAPGYFEAIDAIVARAAQDGAYTMLSLDRLDEGTVFGTTTAADG